MTPDINVAIIAASSALCGALLSQVFSMLQTFLKRRHRQEEFLRGKYEELALLFADSLHWLQEVNLCKDLDTILGLNQCIPATKALTLALLYFPDMVKGLSEYMEAQTGYHSALLESFSHEGKETSLQAVVLARLYNKEEYNAAFHMLFDKKVAFQKILRDAAPKYAVR